MILFISVCVALSVCIYVIWNLLRKVDALEADYRDISISNIAIYEALQSTVDEMQRIDDKGAFQSDDEVGAIFTQLREMLIGINDLIKDENE